MKTARVLPALLAAALLAGCDTVQSVAATHRMVHQQDLMRDVPARIAAMPPAADRTFALASPFSDHMVLQRDMPVPVWGTGTPGAEVEVALFSGNGEERRRIARRTATVGENARWVVLLPSLSAGGPYALDAVERPLARPGEAAPGGAGPRDKRPGEGGGVLLRGRVLRHEDQHVRGGDLLRHPDGVGVRGDDLVEAGARLLLGRFGDAVGDRREQLLDDEAVRIISGSPSWKPGKVRGKKVSSEMSLYIEFRLEKKGTRSFGFKKH